MQQGACQTQVRRTRSGRVRGRDSATVHCVPPVQQIGRPVSPVQRSPLPTPGCAGCPIQSGAGLTQQSLIKATDGCLKNEPTSLGLAAMGCSWSRTRSSSFSPFCSGFLAHRCVWHDSIPVHHDSDPAHNRARNAASAARWSRPHSPSPPCSCARAGPRAPDATASCAGASTP